MSGRHYSPITGGEFDRVVSNLKKTMNSLFQSNNSNQKINEIKRQLEQKLSTSTKKSQKNMDKLSKQYKDLNTQNNSLKKDVKKQQVKNEEERRRLKKEFDKKVNDQKMLLEQKLNIEAKKNKEERTRLREEFNKNINYLEKDYNNKIKTINQNAIILKKEMDNNFKKVQNQLNQIKAKEQKKDKFAKDQLNYLKYLNQDLKSLNIDNFIPYETYNLSQKMNDISENINNGFYEASIATSQDTILIALKLKDTLEMINNEVNDLTASIIYNLDKFKDYKNNEDFTIIKQEFQTDDGETVIEEIDIKYWGEKLFNENIDKYKILKNKKNNISKMNLEEIRSLATDSENLVESFKNTVNSSVEKFYNHILAMESQEVISDKLENIGFSLVDNIHQNHDERDKNIALFENSTGIKIKIVINPENNMLETSFNNLNDIYHNEEKEAIESAIDGKLQDVEGYETKEAPESDFDLSRHLKNIKKNENS